LAWDEKCRLFQDGSAVKTKVSNEFSNDRQYHADLFVCWVVREVNPIAKNTIQNSCFRAVLIQFRIKVGKAVGASQALSLSLNALMWFVKSVFQSLHFIVSVGVCRRVHVRQLLSIILGEFLEFHGSFLSQSFDEERDELTREASEVLNEALKLLHILIIEASQHMNDRFLSNFCCLFESISTGSRVAEERFAQLPANTRRLRRIMDERDPASLMQEDIEAVKHAVIDLESARNFRAEDEEQLKRHLHALTSHPEPNVARSANNTLALMYSRVDTMIAFARDHLLLVPGPEGADAFYNKSVRFGGILYQFAFETQIDDNTALMLHQQVDSYRASLMDHRGFPVFDRQNTSFRLHIVHHLLAVFDQELEKAPDEALVAMVRGADIAGRITPADQALVAVLQLVEALATQNPDVQQFLYSEIMSLLHNTSCQQSPTVAAALARVYIKVFANVELKLQMQDMHVKAIVSMIDSFTRKKMLPPELIYLLATMARLRGSMSARSNQRRVITALMTYQENLDMRDPDFLQYETLQAPRPNPQFSHK